MDERRCAPFENACYKFEPSRNGLPEAAEP